MEPILLLISLLVSLLAFLSTYLVMPVLIEFFTKNGITGIDVHKIDKPVRAEMCGLGAVIGFSVALLAVLPIVPLNGKILAVVLSVLLASAVGVIDELYNLRQRYKVFLLLFAAVPLSLVLRNRTTMYFPLIGAVNFGFLFPFVLVPLGISVAGNLTNMLAGFNGLEAGTGSVALGAVAVAALVSGRFECFLICVVMVAALGAFLFYNWYPAKAFPGDAGTLAIGSSLGCAVIVGKMEFIGVILLLPHIIDFLMKLFGGNEGGKPFGQRPVYGDTTVSSDGILNPPAYLSLPHLFMKARPTTERRLVRSLILCEGLLGVAAIVISIRVT